MRQPSAMQPAAVAAKFQAYPPPMRQRLEALRSLILQTAQETPGVGRIEESLKWGEPAYATAETGSGSTIRIDWKPRQPDRYRMYFNCRTRLVDSFRTLFPHDFEFEGNRAIVFDAAGTVPTDSLKFCIAAALTYRLRPRRT